MNSYCLKKIKFLKSNKKLIVIWYNNNNIVLFVVKYDNTKILLLKTMGMPWLTKLRTYFHILHNIVSMFLKGSYWLQLVQVVAICCCNDTTMHILYCEMVILL